MSMVFISNAATLKTSKLASFSIKRHLTQKARWRLNLIKSSGNKPAAPNPYTDKLIEMHDIFRMI